MASKNKSFSMSHPVVILFVIIAVVASMSLAGEVLKPLLLSVLLAFALSPLASFLERRGLPRVAAVVLTVFLVLGGIAAVGYNVASQLNSLAGDLADPEKVENIKRKLTFLHPAQQSNLTKVQDKIKEVASDIGNAKIGETAKPKNLKDDKSSGLAAKGGQEGPTQAQDPEGTPVDVRVIEQPNYRERLEGAVGPYFESLTVGSFILILVLFMMVSREDLSNRIIALFGQRQLTLTTRTMNEVGERISRYLATNALVNAGFGLVIGTGLWLMGIQYAVLWGVMAALLRFIPYVGTAIAFSLPTIYSVAVSTGWQKPLMVIALFGVVETALNSFLEPIIYGKTTGVSALGLLVAAMFWTWLWGIWGLLLSTPLTVCLAVLGKYVPTLRFFATILGEDSDLSPDVQYYQKLVALDQDGAAEVVEEALKAKPRAQVFEQVVLPALAKAERDFGREQIDEREQAFIWRVTGEILDELEATSEITLPKANAATDAAPSHPIEVLGLVASDRSDYLALRMLALTLDPERVHLNIHDPDSADPTPFGGPAPDAVLVSHLPPAGLSRARSVVRKAHSRLDGTPILVGRWGETGKLDEAIERLKAFGATGVVSTLEEACDQLVAIGSGRVSSGTVKTPALA